MTNSPSDADIIQDAYAERLKAIFDNYVDIAPSDPDGAKTKFVEGVTFLRSIRAAALQALPVDVTASDVKPKSVVKKAASKAK
jgi:hypothetical protein